MNSNQVHLKFELTRTQIQKILNTRTQTLKTNKRTQDHKPRKFDIQSPNQDISTQMQRLNCRPQYC